MSITFYKVLHLLALFLLFGGLGALCGAAILGGDGTGRVKKLAGAAHGVGLVLALFSGFGMLAKLELIDGWGLWVWLKLGIWLLFGAASVLIRKADRAAGALLYLLPLLGAFAAWVALYKP